MPRSLAFRCCASRWTGERSGMTTLKTFVGPAAIYALTSVLSSAIPFLMLPVLTRYLSPDDYGIVTAFTLAVSILGALIGLSVHGAVGIRYFQRDQYDMPRYIGACLTILACTSMAALGVSALAGPFIENLIGLRTTWLTAAVVLSAAQFATQIQLTLWQSQGRPVNFGMLRIFQAALDSCLTLFLVVSLGWAWQGRMAGMVISATLTALLAILALSRGDGIRLKGTGPYVRDALQYGLPLVVHVLGGLLITAGDKIVVGGLLSLEELGHYTVAAQVAMVLNVIFDAVFKAFHPWIIEQSLIAERRVQVVRTIYRVLLATTAFGAAFYVVASAGFHLFVGSRYAAGQPLLLPLVLAAMIRCGYFATAIFINVAGRNEHLAANSLLSGLIGVGAAAMLAPQIGMRGAAYGVVISELLSFLLNLRSSMKVFPMPWGRAWKTR